MQTMPSGVSREGLRLRGWAPGVALTKRKVDANNAERQSREGTGGGGGPRHKVNNNDNQVR
jgi:hypothetical protein